MEHLNIETPRTARYCVVDKLTTQGQHWLVLHGYGQLAEYFIRHFDGMENAKVIAAEGLSRFYLDGLGGRIGASWMTAADREAEVNDQASYLGKLMQKEVPIGVRPVVLGFSQGATAVMRWVVQQRVPVRGVVMWAGSFPHDVDPVTAGVHLKDIPVHFAIGDEDPYIKPQEIDTRLGPLREALPQLEVHRFKGAHVMDSPTLLQIAQSLQG
jgi:predicted esterase